MRWVERQKMTGVLRKIVTGSIPVFCKVVVSIISIHKNEQKYESLTR